LPTPDFTFLFTFFMFCLDRFVLWPNLDEKLKLWKVPFLSENVNFLFKAHFWLEKYMDQVCLFLDKWFQKHKKQNSTNPVPCLEIDKKPFFRCQYYRTTYVKIKIKLKLKYEKQLKQFLRCMKHKTNSKTSLSNPFATRHMWRMALFPNTSKLGYFWINYKKSRSFYSIQFTL